MVVSVKHIGWVASTEAGIPDAGAMIFACLGIALALHGRRAVRPRVLNVACVGLSLAMNALASAPGWRDLAIWIMPSAVYAVASDTLIGVVRARALRQSQPDEEATPLAAIGTAALWLLRLVLAPPSTVTGFRNWVVEEVKVAPGRTAVVPAAVVPSPRSPVASGVKPHRQLPKPPRPRALPSGTGRSEPGAKTRQLIRLAAQQADLSALTVKEAGALGYQLAKQTPGLMHPSAGRKVLAKHVRALQPQAGPSAR